MKRLDAGKFITVNSFPGFKGRELTKIDNNVKQAIRDAIKGQQLNLAHDDEIDVVEFFRWAANKPRTKCSVELRWPRLNEILKIPPEPRTGKSSFVLRHRIYPPKENWQKAFAECWFENLELKKEIATLKKQNEELEVKRERRKENGTKAAIKQWGE